MVSDLVMCLNCTGTGLDTDGSMCDRCEGTCEEPAPDPADDYDDTREMCGFEGE